MARWLTLLTTLPPTPTRHRVGVWRKLQRMGAVRLRGSAWLLPERAETTELFQWLVQEIESFRGEATLLHVDRIENMTAEQVTALFHKARTAEYEVVVQGCREILAQLDRSRTSPRGADGAAALRGKLDGLRRELDRVQAIDYLQAPAGPRALALWETTAKRLRAVDAPPRAAAGRRRGSLPPRGSTWVTRPRPHIDRIASAWLIKRFIDPDATFTFAPPEEFPQDAVAFDSPGVELTHHGEDCTFETLIKRARLRDRRLTRLAELVHEADLRDGKFPNDEARGIDLAIRALLAASPDDQQVLAQGMALFEGLYATTSKRGA